MEVQMQLIRPFTITEADTASSWQRWKQVFVNFMVAMKHDKESEERKIALLLHFLGENCLDIYNSFTEENKKTYESVLTAFDKYFVPKKNLAICRHKFFMHTQGPDTLDMFLTKLRKLAADCEFKELQESLIRDMFICNMNREHGHIRQKLLVEGDIELSKMVSVFKSMEISQKNNTYLEKEQHSQQEILSVANYQRRQPTQETRGRQQRQPECMRCGNIHYNMWVRCPAYSVKCNKCSRIGHFAKMCRIPVNYIENGNSGNSNMSHDLTDNDFFIGNFKVNEKVQIASIKHDDWLVDMKINSSNVCFLLDTGAKANCISYELFCKVKSSKDFLEQSSANLVAYNGGKIPVRGTCVLECVISSNLHRIKFLVVDIPCQPVLGAKTCTELGIVKRIFSNQTEGMSNNNSELDALLNENDDVFQGLGCLPHKCHLTVRPEVQPKIDAQRRVPFALQERLKEELDRMTRLGVIEPVSKPTDWVSSIVIVEKANKKLRICLDPRNLNEAIQRSHFPLPTIEDVRYKLNEAKIFSHLDAYSGFWMIPLDSSSSDLCTFNTPYGRYKYLRLPYGLTCSTEIFSKMLIESFSDIPNVILYVDDILIYAPDEKTHNETLEKVLQRAKSINLKFNRDKCLFAQKTIKFLGQIFSEEGMRPDYEKIRAIQEMPSPDCQKSLQRFLGVINYLGSYIKNLSSETEVLRNLLKKDAIWLWDANHEKAFQRLKDLITKAPVLSHYDNTKPLKLSVDSSCKAMGAVLLQNNQPIAYASKTLTECQKRYAQIEKELFAILVGCQKFHQYVYGKKIIVETDHQPLVTLFKKSLSQVPNRLQRMMLSLQLYDLEVKYVPGSKMYISDTLSRAALLDSDEHKIDDDITIHANMFINSLAVSEKKLQAIKQETVKDVVLQKLREYFLNGWPKHKKNTDINLRCYWDYRAEIHVIDDIVYKNTSIIIPVSMRKEMLKKIHASHAGINRCKSLARRILFWPSMSKDIEQFVDSCEVCLKYRNANPSEPLIISESPSYPWEKIGADLLQFRDKKYLVIVDYYSKYIELALLNTGTSAKHVIMHFKSVLARHGIPLILMTDNGPPFDSREFASFCHEWDIEHITSSPHFPQSNGQAESAVKIVKKILEKSFEDNTDPYLALLHYRCNEKEYMKSPAELLMSRKLRSNLPISKEMLKPKVIQLDIEQNRMNKHKENYKKYHDKHARPLPELDVNDSIMYKKNPNSHWEHGIVKEVLQNYPRSYIIESKEGVRYRRNRRHLLKLSAKCGTKKIVSPCNKQSDNINDHQPLIVSVPITQMLAQICIPVSDSNDNVRSIENTVIESQPTNDIELTTVESPGSRNENDVLSSDVDSYCSLSQQSDGSCTTYPLTEDIVDIGSSCSSNYLVICENSSDVDLCEGSVRENDNEHNYTTRSGRIIKKPKRFEDD